jgi:hypothetical protein
MAGGALAKARHFGSFANIILAIPFIKLTGGNRRKLNLYLFVKLSGKLLNAFGFGGMRQVQWITGRVGDCR